MRIEVDTIHVKCKRGVFHGRQMVAKGSARRIKVIGVTILPGGSAYYDLDAERDRHAVDA
jgi:hypothetical protein